MKLLLVILAILATAEASNILRMISTRPKADLWKKQAEKDLKRLYGKAWVYNLRKIRSPNQLVSGKLNSILEEEQPSLDLKSLIDSLIMNPKTDELDKRALEIDRHVMEMLNCNPSITKEEQTRRMRVLLRYFGEAYHEDPFDQEAINTVLQNVDSDQFCAAQDKNWLERSMGTYLKDRERLLDQVNVFGDPAYNISFWSQVAYALDDQQLDRLCDHPAWNSPDLAHLFRYYPLLDLFDRVDLSHRTTSCPASCLLLKEMAALLDEEHKRTKLLSGCAVCIDQTALNRASQIITSLITKTVDYDFKSYDSLMKSIKDALLRHLGPALNFASPNRYRACMIA